MVEHSLKFGELTTLLARASPEKLQEVKSLFPAQENDVYFRPGQVQGDAPSEIGCAIAKQALQEVSPIALGLRSKLRSRLAWSWRFDLASKFAAACGSGGTVGVLASGIAGSTEKGLVAASIALVGSLSGLLFSYLQRDETSGSISESYNSLIAALADASELQRQLPIICSSGDAESLKSTLAKANEVARTLNGLVLRFS